MSDAPAGQKPEPTRLIVRREALLDAAVRILQKESATVSDAAFAAVELCDRIDEELEDRQADLDPPDLVANARHDALTEAVRLALEEWCFLAPGRGGPVTMRLVDVLAESMVGGKADAERGLKELADRIVDSVEALT